VLRMRKNDLNSVQPLCAYFLTWCVCDLFVRIKGFVGNTCLRVQCKGIATHWFLQTKGSKDKHICICNLNDF